MGKIISVGIIILFCLCTSVQGGEEILCRYCNLSLPFHGCLLDGGTCSVNQGQFCKIEHHEQGGVEWFTVKGCTTPKEVCHLRRTVSNTIHLSKCCQNDMCNF